MKEGLVLVIEGLVLVIVTDDGDILRLPAEILGPASMSRLPMRAIGTLVGECFPVDGWLERDGKRMSIDVPEFIPMDFDFKVILPPYIRPGEQIDFTVTC